MRQLLVSGLMAAGLLLGGCAGFQPLYAQTDVAKNLGSIQVTAPAGRTGYLMRQHLDDALAKDHSAAPRYTMELALAEARFPRGVRIDNVATRYEYVLTATYVLKDVPSGAMAKRGQVRVELTYDSGGPRPYKFTTEVAVSPNVLTAKWSDAAAKYPLQK